MDEPGEAPPQPPPLPPPSAGARLPGSPPPPPPLAAPSHRPPLDLGAAFRFGWEVVRARPGPLVGAAVLAYVVFFAAWAALALLGFGLAASLGRIPIPVVLLGVVAALVMGSMLGQLPTFWMLRAGVDAVDGRPITLRRIIDPAALGPAVAAFGLVLAGTLVGSLLLVLPGFVFGLLSVYTLHFVVDEGRAAPDAVRASIELFRRQPGPALGLFLVPTFAAGLGGYLCGVGLFVSLPVAMVAQVHGFRQLTGGPVPPAPPA